jgi:flagellar hook-associated protein 2
LSINGTGVTKDNNSFTIDGITYDLNSTAESGSKFTVSRDVSSAADAIGSFIDAYNTLVGSLTSLYKEDDYSSDYKPLTDAQENEMSDTEISAWNKKAKSGLLRSNSELGSLLKEMRDAFFTAVGGTGETMASLGITTANYFSDDSGKIKIDKETLAAALKESPEAVQDMFTNSVSSTAGQTGLLYRLSNAISAFDIKADKDIGKTKEKIGVLEAKIDDMNEALDDKANRYYKQFSVMETALSKLNAESSALSSLLTSATG